MKDLYQKHKTNSQNSKIRKEYQICQGRDLSCHFAKEGIKIENLHVKGKILSIIH